MPSRPGKLKFEIIRCSAQNLKPSGPEIRTKASCLAICERNFTLDLAGSGCATALLCSFMGAKGFARDVVPASASGLGGHAGLTVIWDLLLGKGKAETCERMQALRLHP